jgi:hypothetical protein
MPPAAFAWHSALDPLAAVLNNAYQQRQAALSGAGSDARAARWEAARAQREAAGAGASGVSNGPSVTASALPFTSAGP